MRYAETILAFIQNELLDEPDIELNENDSLFQERVLDSLNLVALIEFIERTYMIKIKPSEVTIENLDTVSNIRTFIINKNSQSI